jgi:hypothetical protein
MNMKSVSLLSYVLFLSISLSSFGATVVPLSDAVTTDVPVVSGDGFFCELFLIGGNGTPTPSRLDGYTPDADLQSPVINFPNPGNDVSISSSFSAFFSDTVYAPESVQNLNPSGFIMRMTSNLKITSDLDTNPATPEIDISIRQGSDDGHYLVIGQQFLGSSGEHPFTWYSYDLSFEGEGLYPYYQLFAANSVGISGVELQWSTATSGGWAVIPQENAFLSTAG